MTRARFFFRFSIADLFVEPAVLASPFNGMVDGRAVCVRIPPDARIFDRSVTTSLSDEPSVGPAKPTDDEARTVGAIQVSIDATLAVGAAAMDLEADYRPVVEISDEMDTALAIAREVVSGLVDWSRVALTQHGLGIGGEQPALHEWQRVLDVDAGLFYPMELASPVWATFRPHAALPVTPDFLRQILDGGFRTSPPPANLLLADARHVAWRGDWPRAILLAAMACELRVKASLRSLASEDQGDLVDLLLESPRDFSVPVAGLFDKAMAAVAGCSLRVDDRELYNGIASLFEARNALVHRGVEPDGEATRKAVADAVGAFQWVERRELESGDHECS